MNGRIGILSVPQNHQTTTLQGTLFLHDSSVAIAPSSSLRSERITVGYLAYSPSARSTQICPSGKFQIPASR